MGTLTVSPLSGESTVMAGSAVAVVAGTGVADGASASLQPASRMTHRQDASAAATAESQPKRISERLLSLIPLLV
jgi:hypothetical protein